MISGKVSCVVMDGVTIGHPCCGVDNCKMPLRSVKDHFCSDHSSQSSVCAIVRCPRPIVAGTRTCDLPEHQEVER
ncbi:hypothetical protein BXZ70DRAFT_895208, partial [Cristinia sonorae]